MTEPEYRWAGSLNPAKLPFVERGDPITAKGYNDIVRHVNAANPLRPIARPVGRIDRGIILVKNKTESAIDTFRHVGVGGYLYPNRSADQQAQAVWSTGIELETGAAYRGGIALEMIRPNGIGHVLAPDLRPAWLDGSAEAGQTAAWSDELLAYECAAFGTYLIVAAAYSSARGRSFCVLSPVFGHYLAHVTEQSGAGYTVSDDDGHTGVARSPLEDELEIESGARVFVQRNARSGALEIIAAQC